MSPFAFELIEKLPESFLAPQGKTNRKLLLLATEEAEALRILFEDMRRLRSAEDCVGKLLDNLGDLVQTKRGGRSDEAFRAALRLTPEVRRSAGSVPELIGIARSIAGEYFLSVQEDYLANGGSWEENELWLDGLWQTDNQIRWLDGLWFLSGEGLGKALFAVRIKADTPEEIVEKLRNALLQAKAAGTNFRIVKISE